jgi:hypothetical protein
VSHPCFARGCEKSCAAVHLMCRRHWFMVPIDLRKTIHNQYRINRGTSKEWAYAAMAAVEAVTKKENAA